MFMVYSFCLQVNQSLFLPPPTKKYSGQGVCVCWFATFVKDSNIFEVNNSNMLGAKIA